MSGPFTGTMLEELLTELAAIRKRTITPEIAVVLRAAPDPGERKIDADVAKKAMRQLKGMEKA